MTDFSKYRVMVVEDSMVQRLHALDVLASLSITQVLEASDGKHALELLASQEIKPDILMTDLEMPGMDGVDLIRHIAEQHLTSSLIVVSSRESILLRTVETMAHEHGLTVLGVVQKPISHDNLANVISRFKYAQARGDKPQASQRFSRDEIAHAVSNNELCLHYQPKVTAQSGVMRGVEALVRWQHPVRGLVGPNAFIPDAEATGVITQLTEWVINAALLQLSRWHAHGLNISVAVNLSPTSLSIPELADRISEVTNRLGVEPKYLVLEITESAAMSDVALALGTLARLRLKGFGLSIDDYGTGFSSMQQLSRIPFTELKIDRSLVHGATEKPQLHVMLQSTIEMSKRLHLTTIAEGVETVADWQLLGLLGCDLIQGYYVAKPMPGDQLAAWLKQGTQHLRAIRSGN